MTLRSAFVRPLFLAMGLAAVLPALSAAQNAMPRLKAGYWESTMNAGGMIMTSGFCTDEAVQRRFSMIRPQQMGARDCAGMTPQPIPGGFRMEGTCTNGGRASHIVSTIKGDLNSAYTMDVTSEVDGKPMPPMHMSTRWAGPCAAGLKPGDMVMTMPGGKRMVMNMAAMPGAR